MNAPLWPQLFLLSALAGWLNREQQKVLDYLHEENRGLRELVGTRCPRLTDQQRRRLAAKGSQDVDPQTRRASLPDPLTTAL